MDTNGNRPGDGGEHRQHADGLGIIHDSGYNPRRRRNDAITTGLIGFMVGGISGLGVLAAVSFLAYLGSNIEELIGVAGLVLLVILAGGVTLAVSGYRSVR